MCQRIYTHRSGSAYGRWLTHWIQDTLSRRGKNACNGAARAFKVYKMGLPPKQGLYDPANEHDSCGFGFVADIKGRASHDIVAKALEVLVTLEHRGATGAESDTGDGAGILLQLPRALFEKQGYGGADAAGMMFLPPGGEVEKWFEQIVSAEGQKLLGWR